MPCKRTQALSIEFNYDISWSGLECRFGCCLFDTSNEHKAIRRKLHTLLPTDLSVFAEDVPGCLARLFTDPRLRQYVNDCTCPYYQEAGHTYDPWYNVRVSIDSTCNLHCVHCYLPAKVHQLDELKQRVSLQCYQWLQHHATLIGTTTVGEPFYAGEQSYTYQWLNSLQTDDKVAEIYSLSNYSLLTPDMLTQLQRHLTSIGKRLIINASCDSFQRNSYEKIRVGAKFDLVMRNLLVAYELGLLKNINYVFMPQNESVTDDIGKQLRTLGFDPQRKPISVELIPWNTRDRAFFNTVFDAQHNIINPHFRAGMDSLAEYGFRPHIETVGNVK